MKVLILTLTIVLVSCNVQEVKLKDESQSQDDRNDTTFPDSLKKVHKSNVCQNILNQKDSSGQKKGIWITQYKNGKLHDFKHYKNGVLHGFMIDYAYKNREMWNVFNYKNGLREGEQRIFSLNEHLLEPKYLEYYKNDTLIWMMFPSADNESTLKNGMFNKHVIFKPDTVNISAHYANHNPWYEGTFVKTDQYIKRIGTHKIYQRNGQLKFVLEFRENDYIKNEISNKKKVVSVDTISYHDFFMF